MDFGNGLRQHKIINEMYKNAYLLFILVNWVSIGVKIIKKQEI